MSESQQKTWSVRGVPPELIERVNVVAKLNAMTLGAWVTQVLQEAVDRFDKAGSLQEQRELHARMHQLEAEVRELRETQTTQYQALLTRVAALDGGPAIEPAPNVPEPLADKVKPDWAGNW